MPLGQQLGIGCHALIEGHGTAYGYVPWRAAGITYCVLFGLSMLVHIYQTIRTRAWWTVVFAIGALTELIGWGARTWSSECPYNSNAFLMQICTLIIAPTFFTAGLYVILGRIIQLSGSEKSRSISPISPGTYLWIFCTVDIISLVIQAVGGGMAAVAFSEVPTGDTKTGTNIMVAGIDFQLGSVAVFSALFFLVLRRAAVHDGVRPLFRDPSMKALVASTVVGILLIVTRSIYRTVELAEGWSGYLITTQVYFVVLDGGLMCAFAILFNVFHPALLLKKVKEGTPDNMLVDMEYRS